MTDASDQVDGTDLQTEPGPQTEAELTNEQDADGGGEPLSPSDAALARYRSAMRRSRTIYYAVLAVLLAAVGTWVGVAWSRGEAAHATLHTFAPPPPTLALQAPSSNPQLAWRTGDRLAIGAPQWGGTLVTYSRHTVGGRNARTGARTWSYTRTDRDVCVAAQLTGTAVAVYRNKGNCDEVSAFDSDTGRRRWTRTLDFDGKPLSGTPTYQLTPYTFLASSHAVIYALDPISGFNRWTYTRFGCRIEHVALGSSGALISQNCSDQVRCSEVKFCGKGPQLLLRDGSADQKDSDKPNADQVKWNRIGDTDVPVSADEVVSSVDRDGTTLHSHAVRGGQVTNSLTLVSAGPVGAVQAVATDTAEIIWLAGQAYAVRPNASSAQWSAAAAGPPTVASTTNVATPALASARIMVPTSAGVGILDGNDGKLTQTFPVGAPPQGSLVYALGTGFVVTGPAGTSAYR